MGSERDSKVEPGLPFSEEHLEEDVDAYSFRDDVLATGRALQESILPKAARNEQWIHSEQFEADGEEAEDGILGGWDEYTPKHHRNLLRNFHLTWTARALEDRGRQQAWPVEAAGGDMALAEICNRLMEYQDNRVDRDRFWQTATNLAQPHTCCGTFTYFDPDGGPLSPGYLLVDDDDQPIVGDDGEYQIEEAGTPLGEVVTELSTVFDWWSDGAEEIEDSYWIARRIHRPRPEAVQLLIGAGHDPEEARELAATAAHEKVDTGVMGQNNGQAYDWRGTQVPVLEIFHVPCTRFPEGFRLLFVGEMLVANDPYPYAHGLIPAANLKVMSRRGSPYGSTHLDDAVPVQRAYNEAVSIAIRHAWETRSVWMVTTKDIRNQYSTKGNFVAAVPPEQLEKGDLIKFYQAPGPLQAIESIRDRSKEEMSEAFGIHEMIEGEGVGATTAGRTLAYVNRLSGMKQKEFLDSLTAAQKRVALLELCCIQEHYGLERIVSIVGEDMAHAVPLFLEANLLTMVDIRLEPAAGETNQRAAVAEEAGVAAAEGRMDPALAAEMGETGLPQTADATLQRTLVHRMVQEVLAGAEVTDDPRIDPAAAVPELTRAWSIHSGEPGSQAILEMLVFYKDLLEQQQGPPPDMQAAPGVGPGPAPGPGGLPLEQEMM